METSQGNCVASALSQTSKNIMLFFLSSFFSTKSENRRAEQVWGAQMIGTGEREGGQEGSRRNMVQIIVPMYVNAKMIPVETVPGIREGG
jgi:hypothetical protein